MRAIDIDGLDGTCSGVTEDIFPEQYQMEPKGCYRRDFEC
jgi:hypothetical protein